MEVDYDIHQHSELVDGSTSIQSLSMFHRQPPVEVLKGSQPIAYHVAFRHIVLITRTVFAKMTVSPVKILI